MVIEPEVNVATEEAKRQMVVLIFSVVGVAVLVGLERYMTSPDAARNGKMWAALQLKRVAQTGADICSDVALFAATVYNREKA